MSEKTVEDLIRGNCYDHVLSITGDDDGTLYLEMFENVMLSRYGRLRLAWQSLRGRSSLGCEVVLDIAGARRLSAAIVDHLASYARADGAQT